MFFELVPKLTYEEDIFYTVYFVFIENRTTDSIKKPTLKSKKK